MMLPMDWNLRWKASTTMVTFAESFLLEVVTLFLVNEELATFTAENMPLTANAGESIVGFGK